MNPVLGVTIGFLVYRAAAAEHWHDAHGHLISNGWIIGLAVVVGIFSCILSTPSKK